MTFFDRKEEVIELKMTPYGKRLFGDGRFQPAYYSFYDDDILYDAKYAGFEEAQKDAHERIKETPRTHVQHLFDHVDHDNTQLDPFTSLKISNKDREYGLSLPMGESDQSDKYPAWAVEVLDGELSNVEHYTTGSTAGKDDNGKLIGKTGIIRIPQLNVKNPKCTTKVEEPDLLAGFEDMTGEVISECFDVTTGEEFLTPYVFPDGTTISLDVDTIVLEINEDNVSKHYQNFDIEVFEMIPDETDGKYKDHHHLKPLYFQLPPPQIHEGILTKDTDPRDTFLFDEPDENYVEYYFNIEVDNEISKQYLCSLMPRDTAEGIHSRKMLNCEEIEQELVDIDTLYDFPDDLTEEEC